MKVLTVFVFLMQREKLSEMIFLKTTKPIDQKCPMIYRYRLNLFIKPLMQWAGQSLLKKELRQTMLSEHSLRKQMKKTYRLLFQLAIKI